MIRNRVATSPFNDEKTAKKTTTRFTRGAWLIAALKILSTEGNSSLRIAKISSDLNVSKGSFYWHFKDREDFLHAIVAYWSEEYTERVKSEVQATRGTAREQLRHVIETVTRDNLSNYDVAFDGWASHEPAVAKNVRKIYQVRWRYIRSLF